MTEEHLTDGWEPDLPVSDTLARRFLFNLAAFNELPAVAAGARVLRTDELAAADLGRPAAMHNAATLLRPLPFERPATPWTRSRRSSTARAVARPTCGAPGRPRTFDPAAGCWRGTRSCCCARPAARRPRRTRPACGSSG
jgi:hypothetical protein